MSENLNNGCIENEVYEPNDFELLNSRYYSLFTEFTSSIQMLTDGMAKTVSKNLLNKYNQEFKLITYNDTFDLKLAIKEKKRFRKEVKLQIKLKLQEDRKKKAEIKKNNKLNLKEEKKNKRLLKKANKKSNWFIMCFKKISFKGKKKHNQNKTNSDFASVKNTSKRNKKS